MQAPAPATTPAPDLSDCILVASSGTLDELATIAAQYAAEGYDAFFATIPTSGRVGLYRKAVAS